MSEIEPTPEHFEDPYVLQLIRAISGQQDEIEQLRKLDQQNNSDMLDKNKEIERLRVIEKAYDLINAELEAEIERLRARNKALEAIADAANGAGNAPQNILRADIR